MTIQEKSIFHSVWEACGADVVMEREQMFAVFQILLNCIECTVLPKANIRGIRASPCSPPSPWWMVWMSPTSSSQRYTDGAPQNINTNGTASPAPTTLRSPSNMAAREMLRFRQWNSDCRNDGTLKNNFISRTLSSRMRRCSTVGS